ncbi:MAG TPA: 50S ribosomal protein L35 [Planctomycetota bacterium]|jgi:large subunit ribosomal protein L35|nr:50S ribosomal protein L35 [Planctomycetota bacterium]
MPKHKTNKAAKKRIKVSKNGKLLRGMPGRRHLLSVKSTHRKRRLRKGAEIAAPDAFKIRRLLGLG